MTGWQLLHLQLFVTTWMQLLALPREPVHYLHTLLKLKWASATSPGHHTWWSFSWTTGIRVRRSAHCVSTWAKFALSAAVSTFFNRSSWFPWLWTDVRKDDLASTSLENSCRYGDDIECVCESQVRPKSLLTGYLMAVLTRKAWRWSLTVSSSWGTVTDWVLQNSRRSSAELSHWLISADSLWYLQWNMKTPYDINYWKKQLGQIQVSKTYNLIVILQGSRESQKESDQMFWPDPVFEGGVQAV